MKSNLLWLVLISFALGMSFFACSGDDDGGSGDSDVDGDGDGDSDTDTDADTDADSDGSCDLGGDCDTCINTDCALAECTAEYDACNAMQDCIDFSACAQACAGDTACIQGCQTEHPSGAAAYNTMLMCLACQPSTCSQDCASVCP